MPNEYSGDKPSADPQGQPNPQLPVVPTAPQQNKMGKYSESGTDSKDDKTIQLEKDIRSGERWLIGISAAGVILNFIIALIYYGQLQQMRKSTNAATSAADTADKTLKEIRAGSGDTHELAVQAKNQADRTKDIADRALAQAKASTIRP
jgi:hypothetical protein